MPALLAIPALLAGLASAITQLIVYFLKTYTKKIVIGAAIIAVYTAALVTFIATLNSRLTELVTTLPADSYLLAGMSLVPSNAVTCAVIIVTIKGAQMLLYFSFGIIKIKLKAR